MHTENAVGLVIVIPACGETSLIQVLQSVLRCDRPVCGIEVILVINHSESAEPRVKEINVKACDEITQWWGEEGRGMQLRVMYQPDLPKKKAGVGLARKIGMDEAVRRLDAVGNPSGVIVCLDADCTVEKSYLVEIDAFFTANPSIEGCSITFRHPLEGLDPEHARAISKYEQHLRYFIGMQRWAGLPYAYQTIGSSMAVRADAYCNVGGMNTRQAGEDFYFLHKVIQRGKFAELKTTTVYPSARVSDRVPFGTGRAMMKALRDGEEITTYNPQSFIVLKAFVAIVPELFKMQGDVLQFLETRGISQCVIDFLVLNAFPMKLLELQAHTASLSAFMKRFFHWFDAFLLMKYVHWMRDNTEFSDVSITDILTWLDFLQKSSSKGS